MASKKAYTEHLRTVLLFSGCSQKELEKIAKAGDEVSMPAGSLIVDQGQTGREAFVILSGTVTVKRNGKKISTLGPGNIVGELSLLDHGPRTATVVCETDATFLLIDQRRFLGVVDDVPALAHKLLSSLATRIRDLDRQYFG
jgi:CRP/FNR family transcriptional regulator, cyclic AMP receptor protein